jgi:hypothetical protein
LIESYKGSAICPVIVPLRFAMEHAYRATLPGRSDVLRGFALICALLLDPAAVALTPTAASARTWPAPTQIIQREARPLAEGLGARLAFRATQSLNVAC